MAHRKVFLPGQKINSSAIYLKDVAKSGGQRMSKFQCSCGRVFKGRLLRVIANDSTCPNCTRARITEKAIARWALIPRRVVPRKTARLGRPYEIHGRSFSPEYTAWKEMRRRCIPGSKFDRWYAARGIAVCEKWQCSFEAFLADVGPRPSAGMTIDRIDNDGNYEPGNVRWATMKQQASNRRPARPVR